MILFLLLLAADAPQTIPLSIRRNLPQSEASAQLPAREERAIPVKHTGCTGVALRSLQYSLSLEQKGQQFLVSMPVEPVIEKSAKGPRYPPTFIIRAKDKEPFAFVLENAMASAEWENGGTFRETLFNEKLVDAKFWDSVELVCASDSPYHAPLIPEHVTYKRTDDKTLDAAVAKLAAALGGMHGFGTVTMYGDLVMMGPELYAALKDEPSFAKVQSPKATMIDPNTGKARGLLRFQGAEEIAILGAAMHRYAGSGPPRIRAATSSELAAHWLNIGWDIEEPLLVADYGKHRFIIDFIEGSVWMIDELP